ncbi:hypothetical protein DOTSEDRAFT_71254 [Dothistroma septosporum NZE10]|uniref:Uncharacterized protein n=1 Tax=Dothistroma septosporum (strain NZE10 / CBS 128990) TaxID=675120 RepID=N1PST0_DOTSN|nr:hypothetical protein DOTSEDRAFT_71254 [Dothistroma septosporum NZE10]
MTGLHTHVDTLILTYHLRHNSHRVAGCCRPTVYIANPVRGLSSEPQTFGSPPSSCYQMQLPGVRVNVLPQPASDGLFESKQLQVMEITVAAGETMSSYATSIFERDWFRLFPMKRNVPEYRAGATEHSSLRQPHASGIAAV